MRPPDLGAGVSSTLTGFSEQRCINIEYSYLVYGSESPDLSVGWRFSYKICPRYISPEESRLKLV